jgi:hypothetical protein
MNHDARAIVGTLRDHLASHDRPLSFLFGAGTSCAINVTPAGPYTPLIPAVAALTDRCRDAVEQLGGAEKTAWTALCDECTRLKLDPNIESILGRIRSKIDALAPSDSLGGLARDKWTSVDELIRKTISQLAAPAASTIPHDLPHHEFTRWVRQTSRHVPIEIFTTNYDVLFERTFDQLRVPHFDGFIGSQHPYFSPEAVEDERLLPSAGWIRFWKLHGSVSWAIETVRNEERISRSATTGNGELILPSHRKYDESRKQPYRALMDRLGRILARPDSLLIAAGFSFGDQHINAIVLDALDQHPRTHVIALCYDPISATSNLAKWAAARRNIQVIGPNAAVISDRYGEWTVSGKADSQLTADTGGLVIPNAPPTAGGAPTANATTSPVKVVAGDFSKFCAFLSSMISR